MKGSLRDFQPHRVWQQSREGDRFDDSGFSAKGYYRAATYNYTQPDGTLLYQVLRYEPDASTIKPGVDDYRVKRFVERRPTKRVNANDKLSDRDFVFGCGPRRVLYNWAAIVNADPSTVVHVTEGEKDAANLIKEGLLATTVAHHQWTPESIAALTGRNLIIHQDNDESGLKLSADARKALAPVALATRVITMDHLLKYVPKKYTDDWLTPKKDISDWLEICRKAKVKNRGKKLEAASLDVDDDVIASGVFKPRAEKDLPPWDWIYGYHLLRKKVAGTVAMGGTGKSSLSVVQALELSTGKCLLGASNIQPRRVLLINLEDDKDDMEKRIVAAMKHYGITEKDLGGRLHVKAKDEFQLEVAALEGRGQVVTPNEAAINQLVEYIKLHKIDVVSVDPFVRTHSVHENDNKQIQAAVKCFETVALDGNCAVHLWHHIRKTGGGEVTVESARGAMAFIDACRSVNALETMSKDEAKKLKIESNHRTYFREFNGKVNFAPPTDQSTWFKIVSVELGDGSGFGDKVGVVTAWTHPGSKKIDLTPGDIEQIKRTVAAGEWRDDVRATMWVGKAVAQALGLDPDPDGDRVVIQKILKDLLKAKVLTVKLGKVDGHDKPFVVCGAVPDANGAA